ncbi:hypothetical protein BUALT_Bualt03G0226600 [Buddleja alternifolia]|uniref:Uncharacterized protein n=1 Tax=Buddleja alternifolia TaxID=168488 RepID=A0AAV6Y2T2_9LAMI|nr:hypothetical protein BUALT_Bualt03G0226600 [Buddleja alternifolia]
MDYYNEYNTTKSMNYSSKVYYYFMKAIQILLSVSIFSFLFSQSFSSKFSIKFFTYTTERNCIFLLCNGILVLIIRTSGLIGIIKPVNSSLKGSRIDDDHGEKANNIIKKVGFSDEETAGQKMIAEVENGGIKQDYQSFDIEEHEEEEEEGIDEVLSRDELNKKCEDFIKKVKQEIQCA